MKIVCNLSEVCKQQSTTITKLSIKVGMHRNRMFNYSSCRFIPNLMTAFKIAKALNVSVHDIWKIK